MDQISKFLEKLNKKERAGIAEIIARVLANDFSGMDIKKLKGSKHIFRVRKGSIRIIFLNDTSEIKILSIERRNDTTYS